MNILALDTSALTASVAIFKDNVSIFENNITVGLTHSETLMPMLDYALKSVGMTPSDIDLYAVSNGPGSFTGIRIGVAAAKALAYATGKKVCGVNTLLSLSYNLSAVSGILIAPVMDARRSQVYNALYKFQNGAPKILAEPRALSIEELCSEIKEPVIFVGDGVGPYMEKIRSLIPEYAHFAPIHLQLQKAASAASAALDINEENYVSPGALEVVYLRKSQAERERENKKV